MFRCVGPKNRVVKPFLTSQTSSCQVDITNGDTKETQRLFLFHYVCQRQSDSQTHWGLEKPASHRPIRNVASHRSVPSCHPSPVVPLSSLIKESGFKKARDWISPTPKTRGKKDVTISVSPLIGLPSFRHLLTHSLVFIPKNIHYDA